MNTTLASFTLGAVLGLPIGYALGWLLDLAVVVHRLLRVIAGLCALDRALDVMLIAIAPRVPGEAGDN